MLPNCPTAEHWTLNIDIMGIEESGPLCERLEVRRVLSLPVVKEGRAHLSHERPERSLFLDFNSMVVGNEVVM
ncbi:hypothetical protein E2C01_025123 [Portunus trituberculatus]|uniref:Uncharacterized protein n=1 Tax=Portunus trituberculatus TaxID=210409 RepID=A0A5B7EFP5_PORTR|nr:hypothetical protein [Portunus trituberculatus]